MIDVERFRATADEMRRLAAQATDSNSRASYLELEKHWRALADSSEKAGGKINSRRLAIFERHRK